LIEQKRKEHARRVILFKFAEAPTITVTGKAFFDIDDAW